MRTDALKNLVLTLYHAKVVISPVSFELTAGLLVDFLFYIEFSFVQYCDTVCKYGYFNLRPFCSVERWLPSLDEKTRNHHIIPWLDHIDKTVLYDDHSRSWNNTRFQSLVDFL